jgi:intein/homing endonuclease
LNYPLQICLELSIAGAGGAQLNRLGHKVNKSGTSLIRTTDVGDCIAEGTLVLTKCGYKKIEALLTDDYVFTHKGRWKRVLGVFDRGIRETVSVKVDGMPPLRCTPEHMFRVKEKIGVDRNKIKWSSAHWIEAEELKFKCGDKHYALIPKIHLSQLISAIGMEKYEIFFRDPRAKGRMPKVLCLDEDVGWLFGIFLAEGCVAYKNNKPESIRFSLNKKETDYAERIKFIIKDRFGLDALIYDIKDVNAISVEVYSRGLSTFFMLFGRYAKGKIIPGFVWGAPNCFKKGLLSGVQDGDGDSNWNGMNIGLSNPILVSDLCVLAFVVYERDYFLSKTLVPSKVTGCATGHASPYRVFRQTFGNGQTHGFFEGDCLYKPIKEVKKDCVKVQTFDIAVEDDHSFVVDGGFVGSHLMSSL